MDKGTGAEVIGDARLGTANKGEWPNVCMIIEMSPDGIPNLAGSSLISDTVAITGAEGRGEYISQPEILSVLAAASSMSSVTLRSTRHEDRTHPDFLVQAAHTTTCIFPQVR